MAARGVRAAAGDAGDRISASWFTRSTEFYKDQGRYRRMMPDAAASQSPISA
jgi:hypothetical protein